MESKSLIIPLTKGYYMELLATLDRQKKAIRGLIIALVIIAAMFVCLIVSNANERGQQREEFQNELQQLRQQIAAYETQIFDLEAQNAALMERIEKAIYPLTAEERALVEGVVTAEAGNQGYIGQILVAQCIRNAAEIDDMNVFEVVSALGYAKPKNASESAREAVSAVFDEGMGHTAEPIMYFYAPARVQSEWHESQEHALTYKDHRFFTRRG